MLKKYYLINSVISLLFVFSQKWTKTSVIGHDSITTIILKTLIARFAPLKRARHHAYNGN